MAGDVEIKVDATRAYAKLDRVPVAVRDNLRKILPPLMRQIADRVTTRLSTQLKTMSSLTVNQEIHDDAKGISGVVSVTSPSAGGLLPKYLEEGTEPHAIQGNPILAFPWDFMAGYGGSVSSNTTMAFFRSVHHPGFKALKYMQSTFDEMQGQIVTTLEQAVREGGAQARP